MKTLVLGIGNPILSDDGAGIFACRMLKDAISGSCEFEDVDVEEGSVGGLILLDHILGYDSVIIIDAIKTENGKVGDIYKLGMDDFVNTLHTSSPHDVNFATAIEIGKKSMPESMPEQIVIYGIEVDRVDVFSENVTPEVREAIPRVVEMVVRDLKEAKRREQ